jgi:ribosomal protein S28E/S33
VPSSGSDGTATVALTLSGISDEAGNTATSTGQTTSFVIDNTAPSVSISYQEIADNAPVPTSGYGASLASPVRGAKSVAVQVTATETGGGATLTGSPTLTVTPSGGSAVTISLGQSGAGSKVWRGVYDVPATGSDGPATVALTVSGITDGAGNVASVSSGQTTTFVIDNISPSVALSYALDGTTFSSAVERPVRSGDSVTIKATFVEANGLSVNPRVTLTQIGNATVPPSDIAMTGSGLEWTTTYTVQPSQNATVKISIAAADTAGNSIATTSVTAFVIDNAAPGLSLAYTRSGSANPAGPYRSGDVVTVTATFTEATALAATPTFTLVPGTFSNGSLPLVTLTGTGLAFSGTFTIPAGDGTVTASVGASDLAGNSLNATGQPGFTIDNTPPTVTLAFTDSGTANASGPYKANDSVTVTATFVEANALATTPILTLVGGTYLGGTLPTVPLVVQSGNTYVGTITVPAGNGTVTANVSATDTAGNALTATGRPAFMIDNISPTASVSYSLDGSTFATSLSRPVKSGDTVTVKAIFVESGALYGTPTITLTQSGNATLPPVGSPMTATQFPLEWLYTFPVMASQNATVSVSVGAVDTAGNILSTTPVSAFVIDNTPPSVVLSFSDTGQHNSAGPYRAGDTVTVTANFVETHGLSGTPTLTLVPDSYTGAPLPTPALAGKGLTYSGTFTVPGGNGSVTASVSATDNAGNVLSATGLAGFTVDNTGPTFASIQPPTTTWYAGETPTLTLTFSEPVIGVASSSFTLTHGPSIVVGPSGEPSISSIAADCLQAVPVTIGLKGATGEGTASSTFVLTFASISGITDCAGNDLMPLTPGTVASGTFVLNPGTRPAPPSGGGGNSGGDPPPPAPRPITLVRPPATTVVLPSPAEPVPESTSGGIEPNIDALGAAFGALSPQQAQAVGAAVTLLPPQTAQAFGAAIGGAGAEAAKSLLAKMAALPAEQAAAVASLAGSLSPERAAFFYANLASLPADQLATVAGLATSVSPEDSGKVFRSVADLAQSSGVPVTFATPSRSEKASSGQETITFDIEDAGAPTAIRESSIEVAGVREALPARRTVVILVKPGQVGLVNRPKSGSWPDLALPLTAGKQAGLTSVFRVPADATSLSFEPTPSDLNLVKQGSLGGGSVVPLGAPFALRVTAPDSAGETAIGVQMPSIPVGRGEVLAYLFSIGGGIGPGFAGYLRAPAEFDAQTGRQMWSLRLDEVRDVLFLPVSLRPAYVANHVEDAHIYSSAFDAAIDFGPVGERLITLTVVAPQVAGRIYVYNPDSKGYGWVNANEVGPAEPPAK